MIDDARKLLHDVCERADLGDLLLRLLRANPSLTAQQILDLARTEWDGNLCSTSPKN